MFYPVANRKDQSTIFILCELIFFLKIWAHGHILKYNVGEAMFWDALAKGVRLVFADACRLEPCFGIPPQDTGQASVLWYSSGFHSFTPHFMTRGTAFFITDDFVWESIEFNGDMYPDGHGRKFLRALSKTNTKKEFRTMLLKFNATAHQYPKAEVSVLHQRDDIGEVWFNRDYFQDFFSDWTFWKNASSKPVLFLTRDGFTKELGPGEAIAFSFGDLEDAYVPTRFYWLNAVFSNARKHLLLFWNR